MAGRKLRGMYENKKSAKAGYEGNVVKSSETPVYKNLPVSANPHKLHRQRLRARFRREGLDGFEDHNVLELLLFYGIPVRDVNGDAHNLLEQFGSLSNVFDAKYEDLLKVSGIGENTATLIKLIPQLFRRYEMDKLNDDGITLNTAELVAKYTARYFKGVTEEKLYILCLDANCRLISCTQISSGTRGSAPLNNRAIAETALSENAVHIILVHNHPSGIISPSRKDITATAAVSDLLGKIGLSLSDHIIVGLGDDYFSFKNSQKWNYLFG